MKRKIRIVICVVLVLIAIMPVAQGEDICFSIRYETQKPLRKEGEREKFRVLFSIEKNDKDAIVQCYTCGEGELLEVKSEATYLSKFDFIVELNADVHYEIVVFVAENSDGEFVSSQQFAIIRTGRMYTINEL